MVKKYFIILYFTSILLTAIIFSKCESGRNSIQDGVNKSIRGVELDIGEIEGRIREVRDSSKEVGRIIDSSERENIISRESIRSAKQLINEAEKLIDECRERIPLVQER